MHCTAQAQAQSLDLWYNPSEALRQELTSHFCEERVRQRILGCDAQLLGVAQGFHEEVNSRWAKLSNGCNCCVGVGAWG